MKIVRRKAEFSFRRGPVTTVYTFIENGDTRIDSFTTAEPIVREELERRIRKEHPQALAYSVVSSSIVEQL